jgi:hypothetical protein
VTPLLRRLLYLLLYIAVAIRAGVVPLKARYCSRSKRRYARFVAVNAVKQKIM